MRPPWLRERFPYFVFAVQCVDGNSNWTTNDPKQDNMVDVAVGILDDLLRTRPIDRERIFLAGVSSGGTGCWEMAVRHSGYFAAVAPFASAGPRHAQLERLVGTPIWAFHSSEDFKPPVSVVQQTVAELKNLGGTVELTQIVTGDHDCWTVAFARYHVLDWLLLQRRSYIPWWNGPAMFSRRSRLVHFVHGLHAWQIVPSVAMPLVLVISVVRAVKHRRRVGAVCSAVKHVEPLLE
jgi:pimeloyl-ACP methyl ester carboxylesterase